MPAKKIDSNKNTGFFAGVKSGVADVSKAGLTELEALLNGSEHVKWDGYDFNVEASDQDEDRVLTDSSTASTRGYENFGGSIAFFPPLPGDTTSTARQLRSLVSTPHTELVIAQRDGLPASADWEAGQVYNAYHVISDANAELRGDKNRYYTINFKSKGKIAVNAIAPSSTPTAVAITGGSTVTEGQSIQLKAAYEGNDITVGAKWVSSDETVAVVTPHGIVIGVGAGSASISATYPGSAAGTAKEITVS